MHKRTHDSPRCVLVLRGSVRHRSSCDLGCGAQSAVFVAQHEAHEDAIGKSGAQCFIVELGATWRSTMTACPSDIDRLSFAEHRGEMAGVLNRIRYECGHADDASSLIVDGLLLESSWACQALHFASAGYRAWVDTVRDHGSARQISRAPYDRGVSSRGERPSCSPMPQVSLANRGDDWCLPAAASNRLRMLRTDPYESTHRGHCS